MLDKAQSVCQQLAAGMGPGDLLPASLVLFSVLEDSRTFCQLLEEHLCVTDVSQFWEKIGAHIFVKSLCPQTCKSPVYGSVCTEEKTESAFPP